MLGPQVGDFLCAGASVVEKQDQGAVPQRERAAAGQVVQEVFDRRGALTMWIPLVDCPAAKGSMRFLTASHHAGPLGRFGRRADGTERTEDVVDTYPEVSTRYPVSAPLNLRVGDVTVHDALTVHSAPENETDSIRWVYSITWFPAETLYTGAYSYHTNGLGLEVDQPFDDLHFPVVSV